LTAKLRHRRVRNRLSQRTVSEHSSNIELLNNHNVIVLDETSCELVEAILADVPGMGMQAGDASSSRLSTTRARLAPGQLTAEPLQLTLVRSARAWILNDFAIGEHCQMAHSYIYSDDCLSVAVELETSLNLNSEGDEPSIGFAGDHGG
jgi:hypothetical protein